MVHVISQGAHLCSNVTLLLRIFTENGFANRGTIAYNSCAKNICVFICKEGKYSHNV